MTKNKENWFAEWFDSEHYHLLYQHRDYQEAELFINKLFTHLSLDPDTTKVLDLACGKGRHAIQVNELGYEVLGVDLSKESIEYAKRFENDRLHFFTGDMRDLGLKNEIGLVLNLFTSFGYFQKEGDNRKVINSISQALSKNGLLVLDYLNIHQSERNLPTQESIRRENITFKVSKFIQDDFIVKDISFFDHGEEVHHQEFVKRLDHNKFRSYFKAEGLKIIESFGNYQLAPFDESSSDRLILVAQKVS